EWRMQGNIRRPGIATGLHLKLGAQDGLHSHVPVNEEFDSDLEAEFAAKWGNEPRDGWRLTRESEILSTGQKVFVPDFVFHHESGRSVYFEIVGFWTPEYLQAKFES